MRWMKMLDLKPYGAFVENTIRPLFEELRELLSIAKEQGLELSEKNIKTILNQIGTWYLLNSALEVVKAICITSIVCYTAWMIARWTT